jgi:hypothetical protein
MVLVGYGFTSVARVLQNNKGMALMDGGKKDSSDGKEAGGARVDGEVGYYGSIIVVGGAGEVALAGGGRSRFSRVPVSIFV